MAMRYLKKESLLCVYVHVCVCKEVGYSDPPGVTERKLRTCTRREEGDKTESEEKENVERNGEEKDEERKSQRRHTLEPVKP